jgi:hypothetical protein
LYFAILLLCTFACGGMDALAPEQAVRPEDALVGTWETQGWIGAGCGAGAHALRGRRGIGYDVVYGERRAASFPGSWELIDDVLILRGFYSVPDGESRVNWSLREDGVLLVRDVDGVEQEWQRAA